ncbi:SAM-dependent methyltransferase [Natronospira proteinivora]|uniref:SAM-dependent methyltransferase n=1 Tax=Natronospira proteinivora TaxID=1807133 RepID=A0ABT1G6X3_9GAMM|nr:methyltransferase domain-containing protein [Natronospira proteinivora]MCP1727048.1 SAM-dependent methyltransferase [Natronospira proteinivora]
MQPPFSPRIILNMTLSALSGLLLLFAQPLVSTELQAPYIQTPQSVVTEMLEMAGVGPEDRVLDLGSGDGRIPILAARDFGARGRGIEIDPDLVGLARRNAEAAEVSGKVEFEQADLFEVALGDADVITLYLLPELNLRLRPRLLALEPGTRVVSHEFDMGDWPPDQTQTVRNRPLYLWVIPADVEGRWQLSHADQQMDVKLEQHFQSVMGHARIGGEQYPLRDIRLEGKDLGFRVQRDGPDSVFQGQVKGDKMTLEARPALSGHTASRFWSGRRLTPEDQAE